MANENQTPAVKEPEKAVVFGDINESDIQLPSEKKEKTEPKKEKVESELEEDDALEEGEGEKESPKKEVADVDKKRLGEEDLEEDVVEEEAEEEEEDEEKESDEAENEYTEMSKGGLGKALSRLSPKDLEKVLSEVQLPVRVDGEEQKVNLADLKRSYASKASTTKEFYKVKEWKEKLQSELKVVNETLAPAWEALKAKKIEQTLLELAKIAGYSTLEVKRQLRAEMADGILTYAKMTPEQRKQHDLEEEVETARTVEKERKEREEKSRQAIEREQARYKFQAEHGISDAQYTEASGWLLKNRLGGDASKLTPDGILDYISTAKAVDTALALIERERPSLKEDDAFTDRVIRLCKKYPTASWAQLGKKIQEIAAGYGPKKEKDESELKRDISRKVLKTKPKTAFQTPDKQKKKPMSFDDVLL